MPCAIFVRAAKSEIEADGPPLATQDLGCGRDLVDDPVPYDEGLELGDSRTTEGDEGHGPAPLQAGFHRPCASVTLWLLRSQRNC